LTKRPLVYAATAVAVAALLFLVMPRDPGRSRGAAPRGSTGELRNGGSPARKISAAPQARARRATPATASRASATSTPSSDPRAYERRLDALVRAGTKHSLRELLRDWRTGRVTRAQDRALGDRIGSIRSEAMDKAAGQLLLDGATSAAQRQALAAILAGSGSDLAIGYLLAAGRVPALRPVAARALATVSEPGALPALAAGIGSDTAPEILQATLSALRNIETPKARDLEARVRALGEAR